MKSALFVCRDTGVFARAVVVIRKRGGSANAEVAQLVTNDRMINVFAANALDAFMGEGPLTPSIDMEVPDLSGAIGLTIECRWEDLFVDIVHELAGEVSGPSWVLDTDGIAWGAATVDPIRIRL
jgi:hypothetical protein